VLISNYNGRFSYTVDAGLAPKDVYFVFSNTSLDTSADAASVTDQAGAIWVDGTEITGSVAQPADGPSGSVTGLKDFLARSNRDIAGLVRVGGPDAMADTLPGVGGPAFDVDGGTGTYRDIGANNLAVSVPATCRHVSLLTPTSQGDRVLNIWVADDCWGAAPTKKHAVTQAMVDCIADDFLKAGASNDIYDWVTSILGPEWGDAGASQYAGHLIPFDGKITILLSDIERDNSDNGGVVGYFWPGNNFTSAVNGSNGRIMFVIDAVMYANPDPKGYSSTDPKYTGGAWSPAVHWAGVVFSTLAHEFQHMIQFYRKGIVARGDGATSETWINEMCSQLIEDLVSSGDKLGVKGPRGVDPSLGGAGAAGNRYGRIPHFNNLLSSQLTKTYPQSYGVDDYSFSYAFGSWLVRDYGGAGFVKNVVCDPATDSTSVTNAVTKASGRGVTMAGLLSRWAVAVLGSARDDMPPIYRYNTGAWTSSTEGGVTYQLGSIDFFNYDPPPQVLSGTGPAPGGTIAAAANVYYLAASGITGSRSWTLDVPRGVGFSVVVTP
jgi:hypothetical protein